MDVVQTKAGFSPFHRVRNEYQERVRFPLQGRAPKGLWTRKLEFDAEVLCTHPHAAATSDGVYRVAPDNHVSENSFRRRAFRLLEVRSKDTAVPQLPVPILSADNTTISILTGGQSGTTRIQHTDSHALYFVHRGRGVLSTDFGRLSFLEGDFIHIPRGTIYAVRSSDDVCMIHYEFTRRLMVPRHYWIDAYPFPLDTVETAVPDAIEDHVSEGKDSWTVFAGRRSGEWSMIEYPFSPFDAVAWQGQLYPFVLHLDDVRTLASPDFHVDPKALTVFVTEDESVSIQVFKPRWIHSLPYPHCSYVTELLFNHKAYRARPEIREGTATLHPPGFHHGPDLRTQSREIAEAGKSFEWSDEVAVMLESRSPLSVLSAAEAVEIRDYDTSWSNQYDGLKDDAG